MSYKTKIMTHKFNKVHINLNLKSTLKDAELAGRCSASRPILQDNLDLGVSESYPGYRSQRSL